MTDNKFEPGEKVIVINGNNKAIRAVVVREYVDEIDHTLYDEAPVDRVEVEYTTNGATYRMSPHKARVGRPVDGFDN